MNILFMGSAAFAAPSLLALARSSHKVVEVVAQPDKPAGRGMKVMACPVAEMAKELGLKLYQPKGVRSPEVITHFKELGFDLIVIVAYGNILPNELLEIPPLGCINVHASLLPKYRGAAPINWAIVNGETETGVTTMFVSEELDAGDILLHFATRVDSVETAGMLHDRLAPMGADLLMKTLEDLDAGRLKGAPQDASKATFAPILKKEDGHIDWSLSAKAIHNRVRGLSPWPGTFTLLNDNIIRIHESAQVDAGSEERPGTVVECENHLAVACGRGLLYLLEVQLEGKRRMSAADFMRGHKIEKGTVLK